MLDRDSVAAADDLILILGRLRTDPGVTPYGVASVLSEHAQKFADIEDLNSRRIASDCQACGERFTSVKCREQHLSEDPVTLERVCVDPARVPCLMRKGNRWGWDAAYLERQRLGFSARQPA